MEKIEIELIWANAQSTVIKIHFKWFSFRVKFYRSDYSP